MLTVYKYRLENIGYTELAMPDGAQILSIQMQGLHPQVWVLCDPTRPLRQRVIAIYGTGFRMPDDPGQHLNTFIDGPYVWHAFEPAPASVRPPDNATPK